MSNLFDKEKTLTGRLVRLIVKFLQWLVRIFWIKEIKGLENVQAEGAFILVANHNSCFDTAALFAAIKRKMHFLTAPNFFRPWFWQFFMENIGQIKVGITDEQKQAMNSDALFVLKSGRVLGIFPEGRRSPDGQIGRPFTGAARFALTARVPVLPIGLSGTRDIMPIGKIFPRLDRRVTVNIGQPLDFSRCYNDKITSELLSSITDEIMAEIAELSGKKYNKPTREI